MFVYMINAMFVEWIVTNQVTCKLFSTLLMVSTFHHSCHIIIKNRGKMCFNWTVLFGKNYYHYPFVILFYRSSLIWMASSRHYFACSKPGWQTPSFVFFVNLTIFSRRDYQNFSQNCFLFVYGRRRPCTQICDYTKTIFCETENRGLFYGFHFTIISPTALDIIH